MKSLGIRAYALAALLALAVAPLALVGCGGSGPSGEAAGSDAAASAEAESAGESAASEAASPNAAESVGEDQASDDATGASDGVDTPDNAEAANAASAATVPATQEIGAAKLTGTLEIPADWADTSSLLEPEMVDEYDIVQYADLTTQYTSAALKGDAYSSCIRMQQLPAPYEDIAKEVADNYESDSMYAAVSTEDAEFSGHKAKIVGSQLVQDGLTITDIAIDKENDGKTCVLITAQAMPDDSDAVLSYLASWKLS